MTNDRRFDVVVYGATGFTGGLVAEYLAENGPPDLRWAIAGRNSQKLAAVKDRVARKNPALASLPVLSASADDPASLDALAASTRVVLTTVGPYAKYGEPLVAACVKAGTDYVDITGEPDFVDTMVRKYHETAKEKQLRIVSCCGFDSIPHDLGALFTAQKLAPNDAMTVRGFVRAKGGVSGGTWHSALGAMADLGKKTPSKGGALVRTETKEKKPKRKVSRPPDGHLLRARDRRLGRADADDRSGDRAAHRARPRRVRTGLPLRPLHAGEAPHDRRRRPRRRRRARAARAARSRRATCSSRPALRAKVPTRRPARTAGSR